MLKRKHVCLKISEKIEILKSLDSGETITSVALKYNIGKSTICDIKKNRARILEYATGSACGPGNRKSLKLSGYPDVEKSVYTWFLQERSRGTPLSGELICEKARFFYTQLYGSGEFKASSGWLQNFKHRYGIRLSSIPEETCDPLAVDPFNIQLIKMIKERELTADQLYSADTSGLFWKMLPQKTEDSAPGRKQCMKRITFMPCSNATGSHKLKLLVLGKSNKPRSFGNSNIPVIYKGQERALMTREIFTEWFHTSFVPDVRRKMEELNLPPRAVLIVDNAPVELTSNYLQISVLSCTQPMDQHIIQTIKINYRKNFVKRIVKSENISNELKEINLKDVMFQLAEAWQHVNVDLIKSSWRSLLPSSMLDPGEDEDSIPVLAASIKIENSETEVDEIVGMTKQLQNGWTDEEIRKWALGQGDEIDEIGDSDMLQNIGTAIKDQKKDKDILQSVETVMIKVEKKTEAEEVVCNHVTHGEAVQYFEKCIEWANANGETDDHILILKDMQIKARELESEAVNQKEK